MNVKKKILLLLAEALNIQKETAKKLVEKGANVLITGRAESRLIDANKYTETKIIEFDISDRNIAENAAKCLDIALDGRVDVLVNNAGTGVRKSLDELNIDDFLKV